MDKILPIILLFLCLTDTAKGQLTSPIDTDRPDQSDGTYTLPKRSFQLETGFTYGKENGKYFLHNTMLRYGVTSKTEFRLLVDYGKLDSEMGLMPLGVSLKRKIVSQNGWIPDITAIGYLRIPFLSTTNFKPNKLPANLLLAFQNGLSSQFSLGYNFGASLDGESSDVNWLFTSSLGWAPLEQFSLFAEYFSQFSNSSKPVHNFDLGILWLLDDDLQIDMAIGSGVFQETSNQFVTTGISYRFSED